MPRELTNDWMTQAEADSCRIVFLFEGIFGDTGTPLRLWDGIGDITWDSKLWLGNGWLHGIGAPVEDSEINASNLEITLAGVPQAVLSLVLGQTRLGSSGKIWWAFMDTDGTLIDPQQQFEGKFDTAEITENPSEPYVKLTYESELIELERPKEFRFNQETQKHFYPTDRGFEYLQGLQDKVIFWGRTRDQVTKRHERDKKKKGRGSKDRRR